MSKKLNSMRFLEQHKIPYEVFEFDDNIHSAEGVAEALGIPAAHVYKTLVVLPEDSSNQGRPLLVILSGGRSLDLKKLARATGFKKVRMAGHDEAEKLTGLKVGGISALALTAKNWTVYLDQPAMTLSHIWVSAGQRGINLKVPVSDFVRILKGHVVDCARRDAAES